MADTPPPLPDRPSRDARLIVEAINGGWFVRGLLFGLGLFFAGAVVSIAAGAFWLLVIAGLLGASHT